MTAEMIGDLLRPLIGKSGTIFMVVSKSGQIGFTTDHNKKLTGVKVQEDGMARLECEGTAGRVRRDPPRRDRGRGVERRHGELARAVPVSVSTAGQLSRPGCIDRHQ